jgi:hypothetical protein
MLEFLNSMSKKSLIISETSLIKNTEYKKINGIVIEIE